VPDSLTLEEWERLKEVYVDAAIDAGTALGALLVRLRALQEAEEGPARDRIRRVREVVELATLDWNSRFSAFERGLERVRPAHGSPIHGRNQEP